MKIGDKKKRLFDKLSIFSFNKLWEIKNLKRYINYTNNVYQSELNNSIDNQLKTIDNDLKKGKYKGIIVYPLAVNWNPVQRPHHILREFGKEGYLCFFCEDGNSSEFKIEKKFENVYLVNMQEKLLPLLKDRKVIILITYFLQYLYAKFIPNRIIWLDILDRLEFMSLYNSYSQKIWNEVIDKAKVVSYSADNLKEYLCKRHDAILLENGVNIDDFQNSSSNVPTDIKDIVNNGKKIIGYYGAVENWMDFDLIKKIDESNFNIIIIGNVNENLDLESYGFKNVYFLGPKKYVDLKNYAKHFDVAMIPFKINDVTNSVSPVKFFEYMALHKPVITTDIKEMRKYNSEIVKIVTIDNVIYSIDKLLKIDEQTIFEESSNIAYNNTWKKRVEKVIELF